MLVFGILGLIICPIIFSVLALVWGNADLKEMDAGRMDPSGRGLTNGGRIMGIIGLVILALTIVFGVIGAIAG